MFQIYFDCGTSNIEGVNCMMGIDMVFDRYEGEKRNRSVFREGTTISGNTSGDSEAFARQYERAKYDTWEEGLSMYIGADSGAKRQGGRFDLPPYQIRFKTKANDTELPKLEYDFEKREISFEWEGMFAEFYHEAVLQRKREQSIMKEATEWLDGEDCSVSGALAVSQRNKQERWCSARDIRRSRIKRWYLEHHGWDFKDHLFEEEEEDKALDAIEDFDLHGDFTRCAEDTEARRVAESHTESQNMLEMLGLIRQFQGPRGNDEDALLAMLGGVANRPPDDYDMEFDDESEEWSEEDGYDHDEEEEER